MVFAEKLRAVSLSTAVACFCVPLTFGCGSGTQESGDAQSTAGAPANGVDRGSGGAGGASLSPVSGASSTGLAGSDGSDGSAGSGTGGRLGSAGNTAAGASSGGATGSGGAAAGASSGGATGSGGAAAGASSGGASSAGAGGTAMASSTIENDRFWKDTSGNFIYSQGGGVLQVGSTYYWYGVEYGGAPTYAANPSKKNSDTSFRGITTYSSKDLRNWKLEATDTPANTSGWFGRLGVAYNAKSKKYVLVAQGNGGLYFATSDKPSGGFVYNSVQTALPGILNGATGDQTIFQDDDGQAYLVSSSSNGRGNRYVSPLRPADFLAAQAATLVYSGGGREGNCMFKYSGHYYFCSSDLHGWNASAAYCVSATNIKGPYGAEFVLSGTASDYSHVTQTGFFFNVVGSLTTTVIFAGDRWSDFAGNGLGFNQWMPLSFSGSTPKLQSLSAWSINSSTGQWSVAPQNNWVLNPTFEADRIAVTTPAGWTASNGSNSSDHRTGNWSWQLAGSASLSQTISALPNGSYTLSVWTKSSATGATLYAKGMSQKSAAIPNGATWAQVTLPEIEVSNGQLEIGVTATAQTVKVDDFVLQGAN